ncbi:MAG: class I SAM-dependent methyltransferase [Pseudomonadota bacterium]
MTSADDYRREQSELWNGDMGKTWVEIQGFIDRLLKPFETLLVDAARAAKTHASARVLDIGCGNGTTTFALSRALGPGAACTGIDLSRPMIENAQRQARETGEDITFLCDDASLHPFADKQFDLLASRFGVMFFADPLTAFSRLRQAARDDASLAFVVWRTAEENNFMTAAARAVAPLLPPLPPRDAGAPGPFSLGDQDHTRALLEAAGWRNLTFDAHTVPCTFPAKDLPLFASRLAPTGHDLSSLSPDLHTEITQTILAAYTPYRVGDSIQFIGRCWLVRTDAQ